MEILYPERRSFYLNGVPMRLGSMALHTYDQEIFRMQLESWKSVEGLQENHEITERSSLYNYTKNSNYLAFNDSFMIRHPA